MTTQPSPAVLSVMLAVSDPEAAVVWYQQALGARVLWSMGPVAGLEILGAPFFLHHPVEQRFNSPQQAGTITARIELFVDDPDAVIARALAAGANGSLDQIRNYEAPWGVHRQGGFTDPFGHHWLVGDRSPLNRYPA